MNLPNLDYDQVFQLSAPYEEELKGIVKRGMNDWNEKTLFAMVSIAFSMGRCVERDKEREREG